MPSNYVYSLYIANRHGAIHCFSYFIAVEWWHGQDSGSLDTGKTVRISEELDEHVEPYPSNESDGRNEVRSWENESRKKSKVLRR